MKSTTTAICLFGCLLLNACNDDNNNSPEKNDDRPETLEWIEDTMREKYYWNSQIPASGKLNYTAGEETFFTSLLSGDDGKTSNDTHYYYSYIEKASESTRGGIREKATYGFEFTSVGGFQTQYGLKIYAVLVLYVYPGTPAAEAGLKRGDWIAKINGAEITTVETVMSLFGDVAKEFTVYQWRDDEYERGFINPRTISVGAARAITNYSPVYVADTYTTPGGKQVGYMVYDRFEAGKDDNDTTYDDELRDYSNRFSGVDEFVLDLRYNNGGLLSSAQLLCAIFGPGSILSEKSIGYVEYANGSRGHFLAGQKVLGSGKNLNLQRLYVLTSASTASASEAVINLLDPYMDVIVIGEKTEGKNVGSQTFVSDDKVWEMHPITSKIFNSAQKSDYANGWTPDHVLDDALYHNEKGEVNPLERLLDLGDENERLLRTALYHIDKGTFPTDGNTRAAKDTGHKESFNSLDRKATPVILND